MNRLQVELELQRVLARRRYRSNFLLFCREVMNNPDVSEDVHGRLCKTLEEAYWGLNQKMPRDTMHRYLFLLPRKSLKTTIATIAFPIWCLLQNDPPGREPKDPEGWMPPPSFNKKAGYDQRILLSQEVDTNVRKFMDSIKENLKRNQELRDLYGKLTWDRKADGLWKLDSINIPWRQDLRAKEGNVSVTSLKGAINSMHCDIAVFDDIFSSNQLGTMDQVIRYYQEYAAVADNPSLLILVGTRWHDSDLYGHILKEEPGKWTVYRERAERTDAEVESGLGRYFFPAKLGPDVLADMKSTMSTYLYSCQMQNDPIDPDTAMFKSHDIEQGLYDLPAADALDKWLVGKVVITTGDPAITDDKKGCYATITTCAWDSEGAMWVLDVFREKSCNPGRYIDELFRQYLTWKSQFAGLESTGFQRIYRFNAEQISRKTGTWLPWVELKHGGRSKDLRIMGLEPLARSGKLHLRRRVHQDTLEEFLRFPYGSYKDTVDALAYQLDIAFVPAMRKVREEVQAPAPGFLGVTELQAIMMEKLRGMHLLPNWGPAVGVTQDWYNG